MTAARLQLLSLALSACAFAFDYPRSSHARMSVEEQMTYLSNAVYGNASLVAGWHRVHSLSLASHWFGEHDKFAIFQKNNECVIAFSGTDSVFDITDNFDGRTVEMCGFEGVHRGFASEVNDLLEAPAWHDSFRPHLAGNECSGGVTVVGHSLGGAQAAIFAACANNGSRAYGFAVKALYTHGGAAPSKTPLPNREAADGCFSGARFYTEDRLDYDPIPALARALFFEHPRVPAVRLSRPAIFDGSYIEYYTYGCNTTCAANYPNPTTHHVPSITMHLMAKNYIPRVIDVYSAGKAQKREGICDRDPKMSLMKFLTRNI